jgi:hypothetical protein
MRYDDVTTDRRSMLLSPAVFHRDHYARLIGQLEAQSFAEDDRLYAAVARAKAAVDSLVFLLAERPPHRLGQATP